MFSFISGNENVENTRLLTNLFIHKSPHYERAVIYSPQGEATTEYSDVIDCDLVDYAPDFDFFDSETLSCFVLEDCEPKLITKDERYKQGRFSGVDATP